MNSDQLEILRWIGDGCPERAWPDHSHKQRAYTLASRGLALVFRQRGQWTASITDAGRYYLQHGRPPPEPKAQTVGARHVRVRRRDPDDATTDVTAHVMRRVAEKRPSMPAVLPRRQIKESFVRYKVVVTRVQVAEKFVRATDEDAAAKKVQEEFDRPYGYFGSWKTVGTDVDITEVERIDITPTADVSKSGALLLSIKEAAKALGVSYSTAYQMLNQGDIEWVAIGSRKYIARDALLNFIQANTHKGYYFAG